MTLTPERRTELAEDAKHALTKLHNSVTVSANTMLDLLAHITDLEAERDEYRNTLARYKERELTGPTYEELKRRANRAEAALAAEREITDKKVERAAIALLARQGFGFYTNPMEGGQDAYDISCEALEDARTALLAAQEPS